MKNIFKNILFVILFFSTASTNAQSSWNYVNAFGGNTDDVVRKVRKDSNDNIYLYGLFHSDSFYFHGIKIKKDILEPEEQLFLIKINSNDSLLWYKVFGASGQEDGCDITIDSLDNVYVSYFSNTNSNTNLIKYSSSGNVLWTKYYPNSKGKSLLCSFSNKVIFANKDSIYSYFLTGQKINARRAPLVSAFYYDANSGFFYADGNNIVKSDEQLYSMGLTIVAYESDIRITSFVVDSIYVYTTGYLGSSFTNGNFNVIGANKMFVFKQQLFGDGYWLRSAFGQSLVIPHKIIQHKDRTLVCGQYRNFATFDTLSVGAWGLFEEAFVVGYNSNTGKLADFIYGGGGGDYDIAYDMIANSSNEVLVVGMVQNPPNGSPYFGNIKVNSKPGASDGFYASFSVIKPLSKISGLIQKNAIPLVTKVRLYKYVSNNALQVISETNTDNFGKYSFSFSDTGTYFVKAFDPSDNFIDTYEPSNFRWEHATKHKFSTISSLSNVNISILEPLTTIGVDTISGNVLKSNNEPLRFIRVILCDTNNVFINFTKTDTFGYYSFRNVPFGTFNILLDTTGIFIDSFYTISIDSNYINFTYDYVLDNNYLKVVHKLTSGTSLGSIISHVIFPNPTKRTLFISNNKSSTVFEIRNLEGKLLLKDNYSANGINLDVLPYGTYTITIWDKNNKSSFMKFIKQ